MSDRSHAAGLIAIGDELLAGAHPDLDSPLVARCLAEVGRHVERVAIVGDDEQAIAEAMADMARRYPLVITSGGLGPTLDDVTRHAAARAAERPLVHSEEAMAQVKGWYQRADRPMPDSNERQALVPEGSEVLPNRRGTAPGFRVELQGSQLFVLPGPPHELDGMLKDVLRPWLVAHPLDHEVFAIRRFHLYDLSESVFADGVGQWMGRDANPLMGVTAKRGVLSVRLLARGGSEREAAALLDERAAEFLQLFGERVFSESSPELAFALGEELLAKGITVTTAESCTGGMVASELTRVPGISALLSEAVVCYSDAAKTLRLGVDPALLEAHGAVSEEVAEAMARGAAERAGAELAVSVTGVAGPGGGTPQKPVGLVCFAVSLGGRLSATTRRWPDAGRDRVREWATSKALALMLEAVGKTLRD
jgi:nicotinamide-nucleotide amidase